MTASRHPSGLGLAVALGGLAAAAVLINVFAPTVFFDVQIMLGVSLGVYAILEFGWAGLVVGVAALMVTLVRWRHPFALLIGTVHLIWLKVFLDRFNGGLARQGNGRIVLASIAYWIVVGLPCALLHCTQELELDLGKAAGLSLKACVASVLDTSLGLVLYQIRQVKSRGAGGETISARGATFSTVLMAVTLPGILMTMIVSSNLQEASLESLRGQLRSAAAPIAARLTAGDAPDDDIRPAVGSEVAVQARAVDGRVRSSDPELFRRLETDYEMESPNRTGVPGLDVYAPRESLPTARVGKRVCYWVTPLDAPAGWSSVTAVHSAPHPIRILDQNLLFPLFSLLFGLQVVAATIAEVIATIVDGQFRTVLAPTRAPVSQGTMPDLNRSSIAELNEMVGIVNEHARRINELTASLERSRTHEKELDQRRQAELQHKLKTSLAAAAIAHEINMPLSSILLGSKIAADMITDSGPMEERLRPVLAGLVAESERVVDTIARMRMLLRSVQTELVPVDAVNVVRSAMMQIHPDVAGLGIVVSTRGLDAPCMLSGDAGQLRIAVVNLLRNATEAVAERPAEYRRIDVEVNRSAVSPDAPSMVEIVVGDSGPGLPAVVPLGEPLETTKPDGSGLGLYVARAIMENHGGEIRAGRSSLGGAEVRLRLAAALS